MTIQKKLNTIFNHPKEIKYGLLIQSLIYLNIIVSILVMFLETEKSLQSYANIFTTINNINIFLFTIEYILRMYAHFENRFKFALTPLMLVDIIVLLPFYLTFFNIDLGFLRTLRVLRIFKMLRIAKFTEFDTLLGEVLHEKKEEFIFILVSIFIFLLTLTPLVYYAERLAQPEVFNSMSSTMWWAVTTFTTVGYGDMYPITTLGRILTTIISFLGIAFYAIPGSIFTSSLLEKINEKKSKKIKDIEEKLNK